jgi:hypothetical protein
VTPFNIAAFRTAFPEFRSLEIYPDQMLNFWVGLAQAQVRQCVWKLQWNMGVSLYLAHELVLAVRNANAAEAGGAPGTTGGIASQKTVGSANITYDPQTTTEKDAGFWNQTTYGKQFIRLARMFGTGAIQL